jgi:hypothetical protein
VALLIVLQTKGQHANALIRIRLSHSLCKKLTPLPNRRPASFSPSTLSRPHFLGLTSLQSRDLLFPRRNQKAFTIRHKCLSNFAAANASHEITVFEAAQASKPPPPAHRIPRIPISIHSDLNFDLTRANELAALF